MRPIHLLVVIALIGLAGCIRPPTNTREFRLTAREHPAILQTEHLELGASYKKVLAGLQEYATTCLNTERLVNYGPGHGNMGYVFVAEIRETAPSKAELWYTINGAYRLVADVEPAGGGRTKVTVYTPKQHYTESIADWGSGKPRECDY